MNEGQPQPQKMGSIKRGWIITKSAWHVLKLDKELLIIPLIAGIIGLLIAILGYGTGLYFSQTPNSINQAANSNGLHFTHTTYAIWIATSAVLALLSSYTIAAMIAMTLKRLRGGDPVLRDGFRAVKGHFGALSAFTLVSFGIVQILQYLQNRLPLFGKILAFLGEFAWRVAAFFAIPVIVDSEEFLNPIDATKQSMGLIKKTWKESSVNSFTMGTIFFILIMLEIIIGAGITVGSAVLVGAPLAVFTGVIAVIGLISLVVVSSAMEGIAKAVLYYYAVTGEAPALFDQRLLQEAFTPKKARKVFGI